MLFSKSGNMGAYASLQKLQDLVSKGQHIACRCYESGRPLTESSWDKEELYLIKEHVDFEELLKNYQPHDFYELEEVSTEYTIAGPVKTCILTVRMINRIITWGLAGIMEDRVEEENRHLAISEESFDYTVDLITYITKEYFRLYEQGENASREVKTSLHRDRFQDEKTQHLQVLNDILVEVESEGGLEEVVDRVMEHVRKRLQFSDYSVYYEKEKWEGHPFKEDSTYMISSDTPVPEECRKYMAEKRMRALMRFPLKDHDRVVCIVELWENKRERIWELEEIHFSGEVREIMQRMLEKRINRQSLTASFLSMKSILENVDFGIAVVDQKSLGLLLVNGYFRRLFERDGILAPEDITYFSAQVDGQPIYFERQNLWVHFHKKSMQWVDGRQAYLLEAHDLSEYQKEEETKEEPVSDLDQGTDLYNARKCRKDFENVMKICRSKKRKGALICLDIDNFKQINSRFGVVRGDEILREIASRLKSMPHVGKNVYRLRSDEFYVLIGGDQYKYLEEVVSSLLGVFAKPWEISNIPIEITASIGVVVFPDYGEKIQDIEAKVEVAMYQAKAKSKNCAVYYNSDMAESYRKKVEMEIALKNAVRDECKEMEVYYQPIMDVRGKEAKCVGAEALVRWNSAKFGLVSPVDFIPIAEENGLIAKIGEHVLGEACKACRFWNDFGHPEFRVNVNFSVIQFMQMDIEEVVRKHLTLTHLNPNNLVIEITESIEVDSMIRMNEILDGLHSLGCRVALDDFGTGYASMSHVRDLTIDTIKVDQVFVQGIMDDQYSDTFIKMVTELADVMHVDVCVEGVENEEQYRLIREHGVRCVQGYYFNRPLPRVEFEKNYLI